jgi:hypothetical protein
MFAYCDDVPDRGESKAEKLAQEVFEKQSTLSQITKIEKLSLTMEKIEENYIKGDSIRFIGEYLNLPSSEIDEPTWSALLTSNKLPFLKISIPKPPAPVKKGSNDLPYFKVSVKSTQDASQLFKLKGYVFFSICNPT